ncbi:hypothetical protein GCM10011344_33740 [Dokdonia pacifica]|uniref:Uncharacterized protein n=1 Tax=Dokdonia pacifica TaxID=1627892 RepID=A0A239BE61_9FLAO|nr:hypothetical protein [Dokdonia pacifica]GGG30082.1 hypothetical protein GCM10011344_33740 [Dokdonia pacifica]SNS05688.1 hypothetical protein SAMN06265376_10680 [Dokdonia pacifica]
MKEKKLNMLVLNKEKIAKIVGGIGDPPPAPGESGAADSSPAKTCPKPPDPDHTRGCPSWNVAC